MPEFRDRLDRALEKTFTRPAPKSAQAQMKYLVKQLKGTKAAAEALGISQRTVERYVTGKIKRPRQDLRGRLEGEVKRRWQPQIRAKALRKATRSGGDGIIVSVTARFGYEAAAGTTDQARVRSLPPQVLPPEYAERLYAAREAGDTEDQLRQIAAEGLAEVYFRANNTRAAGLEVVLNDVLDLDIQL
ncbi:telomere-protecting terminal protein Tpg [Streptomyces hydrogenans]|uniref:telomere-protecting terminal protein Tpg n=1 Tax=Streptomyces hydrogenans TaxID=1873719 RepID=UPI0035D55730